MSKRQEACLVAPSWCPWAASGGVTFVEQAEQSRGLEPVEGRGLSSRAPAGGPRGGLTSRA